MKKWLHYLTARMQKKNLLKAGAIYLAGTIILIMFGVNGLMITFFLILFFFFGFVTNKMLTAIRDYRLTLQLNRVHFSQIEYTTLKQENKVLLESLQSFMSGAVSGRGGKPFAGRQSPPTTNNTDRLNFEQLEEMKMRYEAEEQEK